MVATRTSLAPSFVLALAVVGGASAWGIALGASGRFGARFASARTDRIARTVTGVLMLAFAVRTVLRLVHG